MQRDVLPELLDSLPHDDPAARVSRAELCLINALMGNHRWIARQLLRLRKTGHRVLELGAGDGTLGLRLIKQGLCEEAELAALDLAPRPEHWPTAATWQQTDLFALPHLPDAEVIVANLFLHHFQSEALAAIGVRVPAACRVLIFSEPARRALHLWQGRLLAMMVRLSAVTRHDMLISIRAGFAAQELPQALGLQDWKCEVSQTWLGAYRVVATR